MDLNLKDRTFIVTDGASGIGTAISMRLAGEGAVPLICGKDTMSARFEAQLMALQPRARHFRLALVDERACGEMVARAAAYCGHIDGVVKNAGINEGLGLDAGGDAFVRSRQANLVHYFVMAHPCLPHLQASRGAIVNISSKLDLRDAPALMARYETLHRRTWPEVAAHLRSHGVTGMETHRLGTRMVMVMETDDAVHDPRAMSLAAAIDPKLRKWEVLMWTFQAPTPWTPPGDKWTPMACIFRLADAAAD